MRNPVVSFVGFTVLLSASSAFAQTTSPSSGPPDRRWAAEVAIGWDNAISGNVVSSGIGVFSGLPAVIQNKTYGDVYGTGIQWRFGAGYMLDARQEVRGTLTIQNASADALEIGTLGGSPLFATFGDYQVVSLDGGYRYHFGTSSSNPKLERIRPYAGATMGIAVIDRINTALAAPAIGIAGSSTDFYDGTAAFAFGLEGGVLVNVNDRVDIDVNLGFRYVSGLADVDDLQGTGLEDINNDSGRWSFPIMVGARIKF
jgi:hypothetical protein